MSYVLACLLLVCRTMGGVFKCELCGKPQRGGTRFRVTDDNVGNVRARLVATGRDDLAALAAVGMVLCTFARSVKVDHTPAQVPACMSKEDQAAAVASLVGRCVTKLLQDVPGEVDMAPVEDARAVDDSSPVCNGVIRAVADSDVSSYTAIFETLEVCGTLSRQIKQRRDLRVPRREQSAVL